MTETAADLPADYRDIPDSLPEGMALSSRIVEPLLVIRKAGPAFRIVLAGRRMVRGTDRRSHKSFSQLDLRREYHQTSSA